jgi:hypothetical protein
LADPQYVVKDRELERGHEKTTEKLAQHRWHWTLDESNPRRISLKEYARRVDRGFARIHAMAHGYADWQTAKSDPELGIEPGRPVKLIDFIEQAKLGAEKAAATQAVAAATGKAYSTISTTPVYRTEVREVLATAQDRAERHGTTLSEELPNVAKSRAKARQAKQTERRSRKEARTLFLVQVEGHLGTAIRQLRQALDLVRDADFTDDEVEALEGTLENLKTFVRLIDVRLTGNTGLDWDEEFASIMEEAS